MFNIYTFIMKYDGSDSRFLIDAYPDYPVYAVVLYLVMVFYLPDYLAKRKKTFTLKYISAAWNLFLSVFSTIGTYYCLCVIFNFLFVSRDFFTSVCEMLDLPGGEKLLKFTKSMHGKQWEAEKPVHGNYGKFATNTAVIDELKKKYFVGPAAFFISFFLYLKTPELLDTLFLILQGKPVSFLHWFHHLVTAIYCWHGSYVLCPSGLFFIAMNYTVHSVMYFYYFLVVMGLRNKIRWFAPVITLMQISQMFFGMFVTCYTYFQYYCGPTKQGTWFYAICEALFSRLVFIKYEATQLLTTGSFVAASKVPEYKMIDHFYGCDTDTTNLRMAVMMFTAYCVLFCVLFKELYLDKAYNKNSIVLARHARTEDKGRSSANGSRKGSLKKDNDVGGNHGNSSFPTSIRPRNGA